MSILMDDPIHPGEILREEFLREYDLTAYRVADSIGVPRTRLERILRGDNGISADTALRLGRYFDNSPEFWLNLQRSYDLAIASKKAVDLADIVPVVAA